MTAIVSIGAGPGQYPLIAAAHDAGLDVIAIDRAPADICRPFITQAVFHSTFDTEGVIGALADLRGQYPVQAVLARTSGPAVLTAARVADYFGVPGVPLALAQASVSKWELKRQAEEAGIPTPAGESLARAVMPASPLPLMVKPDMPMTGKQNVYRIHDASFFAAAFAAASAESQNDRVTVETFIDGVDVGYMVLLHHGRVVLDLLYDEFVAFDDGRARALGIGGPSLFSGGPVESQVRSAARSLLSRWQFAAGFAFFSFRVNEEGVFLYEANPGLCGDAIADAMLPALWPGFDPFRAEVQAMTGVEPGIPAATPVPVLVQDGEAHVTASPAENLQRLSSLAGGKAIAGQTQRIADCWCSDARRALQLR